MKNKIKIVNLFLLFISVVLSCVLFNNKTFNFDVFNKLFITMSNHMNINDKEDDVSFINNYIKVNEYTYTNDTCCVYLPLNATVIEVGEDYVTLKGMNNIYFFYKNLVNICVGKLDCLNQNDLIGNFIDTFTFYLYKEGKLISYEEAF